MSMFRRAFWMVMVLLGYLLPLSARAESEQERRAQELLEACQKTYANTSSYQLHYQQRVFRAEANGQAEGKEQWNGGYRPRGENQSNLLLSHLQRDEWQMIYREPMQLGSGFVAGKSVQSGQWQIIKEKITEEGRVSDRRPVPKPTTLEELEDELTGSTNDLDPVLYALLMERDRRLFSQQKVVHLGTDTFEGHTLERVGFMKEGRMPVVAWIDERAGVVCRTLRVVVFNQGKSRMLLDACYVFSVTPPTSQNMSLDTGWSRLRAGHLQPLTNFSAPGQSKVNIGRHGNALGLHQLMEQADDAYAWLDRALAAPSGGTGAGPGLGTEASALVQSLTAEQMEAIVLIEGDEGVGTGFVAKMRGLDFVVTNLHVIGGNEKLRITTLRGVPITVNGMFGAAGRDIAILRIEGENKIPALTLAADPFKTAKLGDKVVVVGNRRGGGVATQVSGAVRGVGPDRLEVDAPFQPGNSGSPIVHLETGEVLGVASYSQTRKFDELDGPAASTGGGGNGVEKEEQRWFGFRTDEVAKWEAIDLAKWRLQAKRIADFEADTQAIFYTMHGKFSEGSRSPRVKPLIDRFDERVTRAGGSQVAVSQEVGELFRSLRALSETGVKDLETGNYYDFFRTSGYWETSIPQQLSARKEIAKRLDKASDNSAVFLAKLRR